MFMSDLTLYLAPGTCAMAVRIASPKPVPLTGSSNRIWRLASSAPRYLAINPKAECRLVTERGVLTETPALLLYVAQRFPDATGAAGRPLRCCPHAGGTAFSPPPCARRPCPRPASRSRWADPQAIAAMQAKVPHNMRDGFARLNATIWPAPGCWGVVQPGRHLPVRGGGWLESDGGPSASFPRWRITIGACWHALQCRRSPLISSAFLRGECSSGTRFSEIAPSLRSFSHFVITVDR
jgi:glutathione S-transferase